jgi:hypothetical protein
MNALRVKRSGVKYFLALVLLAEVGLALTGGVKAQMLTTLHHFTAASGSLYTNSDGGNRSGSGPKKILSAHSLGTPHVTSASNLKRLFTFHDSRFTLH